MRISSQAVLLGLLVLAGTSPAQAPVPARSVVSVIDRQGTPQGAGFAVRSGFIARGFRLRQLDPGVEFVTGRSIPDRSFRIENTVTGETVYRYATEGGRASEERPVRLRDLVLRPGVYRLYVSGGRGAVCALEYGLASRPGAVPKPAPVRKKKPLKPPLPAKAEATAKAAREIENACDLLVLELDGLEEDVEALRDNLDRLTHPDNVRRYLEEIKRLRAALMSVARRREDLRDRAKSLGLDFESLAGDQRLELDARPRGFLADISLLEDQAIAQEQRLEARGKRDAEAASSAADIENWLKYAEAYARRTGVRLNLATLKAAMEAKAADKVPARVVFYGSLFYEYVDGVVAAAQKRTSCKVSGRVVSLNIEAKASRLTYAFEIINVCPERTTKNPGSGGMSFEQLETLVRDTCRGR